MESHITPKEFPCRFFGNCIIKEQQNSHRPVVKSRNLDTEGLGFESNLWGYVKPLVSAAMLWQSL